MALALLFGAACGHDERAAAPRLDATALAPAAVAEAVVARCHPGLRGQDRALLEVTCADGGRLQIRTDLPERVRIHALDGSVRLVRGAEAFALADGAARPLQGDERVRTLALAALADFATLGPLRRARGGERAGPQRLQLTDERGERTELELQPGSALVARLSGARGDMTVLGHLHTATSWLIERVSIAPLGECTIRFASLDLPVDEAAFALPQAPVAAPAPAAVGTRRVGGELRPTTPQIEPQKATRWLVCDDPGDWTARAGLVREKAAALVAGGQSLAGFPAYFEADGRARLAIGFRARNGSDWTPPADWQVREQPAGRVLVVFPDGADYAERIRTGAALLRDALAAQRLEAQGPIQAQPYLHLEDGVPPPDKLQAPVVRMAVTLR